MNAGTCVDLPLSRRETGVLWHPIMHEPSCFATEHEYLRLFEGLDNLVAVLGNWKPVAVDLRQFKTVYFISL